jgi:hypothetical protein
MALPFALLTDQTAQMLIHPDAYPDIDRERVLAAQRALAHDFQKALIRQVFLLADMEPPEDLG